LDFDGGDLLKYAASNAVTTSTSGHVFAVVYHDSTANDQVVWATSDEVGGSAYMYGRKGTGHQIESVQTLNNSTFRYMRSNGTLSVSTAYLLEWASTGTAYEFRINNTVQTLSVILGSNNGDWIGDTTHNNFTVGAVIIGAELSQFNGRIGEVVVVDGAIAGGDRTSYGSYITSTYGITLA
jgi:hypothetical protein